MSLVRTASARPPFQLAQQLRRRLGLGREAPAGAEAENAKLKWMYADLALENAAIETFSTESQRPAAMRRDHHCLKITN
jgi:hypothetical protein